MTAQIIDVSTMERAILAAELDEAEYHADLEALLAAGRDRTSQYAQILEAWLATVNFLAYLRELFAPIDEA